MAHLEQMELMHRLTNTGFISVITEQSPLLSPNQGFVIITIQGSIKEFRAPELIHNCDD